MEFKAAADESSHRCSVLPDPHFAPLKEVLSERLQQVAARITPENFGSFLDPLMRDVFQQGLADAAADGGTLWLVDQTEENLVAAYNTGPNAKRFVGSFRQPLDQGLISMVFASEQPFVENEVYKNARQSRHLDSLLGIQTQGLIAVPFYFLKRCRGVASCVQTLVPESRSAPSPGFTHAHLAAVHRAVGILRRLLEYGLIARTVCWETD